MTPLPWHGPLTGPVGARLMAAAQVVGKCVILFGITLKILYKGPFEGRETLRQMKKIGIESLPIVLFTAVFAGVIMIIQSAGLSSKLNMRHLMGWGAGFAILREVGPVMIGLMFSGRVGANITAELGTMTVTEQIDGLRALAIDPMRYLVVPRFTAIVIMLLALLIIGDVVALLGAMLAAKAIVNLHPDQFINSFLKLIRLSDLFNGMLKITMFGALIATVSCAMGLSVNAGARDVGRAVNTTVVFCAIGILLLDYLLTVSLG